MTHQLGVVGEVLGYVDRRRGFRDDLETRVTAGPVMFTANAGGTTTTIVGANATPSTNVNCLRLGEEFKLFTAAGVLKQETVFRVTAVAVGGSTTITFTPAAAVATISTDTCRLVGVSNQYSNAEVDRRLVELGFSAARIATLTENDKVLQLRTSDDSGSL